MTLATDGLETLAASAAAPDAAAGGTAAPAPADAGGGAPVTPAAGAAATPPSAPVTPTAATTSTTPATPPSAPPTPPTTPTPAIADDPNWRATFAQGDADLEKRLARFASPADFVKSYKELHTKVSSGELKRAAPGPEATPEELKAWRTESGIPETPEGYFEKIELPTGVTMGEADKPLANSFAEYAHKANMTPAQVSQAMAWYYDTLDKQTMGGEEADATNKIATRDALHGEWRGDFKANMAAMKSVVDTAPDEVKQRLFGGRTIDGKVIGDDPAVIKWLAGLGRELNPAATILPPGMTTISSVDARLEEIKGYMGSPKAQELYWSKPAVQEEYRKLVEAQQKMQARN